jgi:hypothetical protein
LGTSKSYNGPSDKTPLLPDWALPTPEGDLPLPEEEEPLDEEPQGDEDDGDEDNDGDDGATDQSDEEDDKEKGGEAPKSQDLIGSWRSAKTRLGKVVKKFDKDYLRKAAWAYVKAHGGSRQAAQAATSGRTATARLGRFLADVANRGLNAALEGLNLASVIGKDPKAVFAAICNALAPDGGLHEQAVARQVTDEVLSNLYEACDVEADGLAALDRLTGEDVAKAMLDSVTSYIYHRWLQELGKQLEAKAISSPEAVRLERETWLFVKDSVAFDFQGKDPLAIDWARDGQALVERIYTEAYSLFGAG